jgi:predicted dehydrogenase
VVGERGELVVRNLTMPHLLGKATVKVGGTRRREKAPGGITYRYQLAAFCDAVLRGAPVLTPPADSIATMAVVDAVYTAAGLPIRGT